MEVPHHIALHVGQVTIFEESPAWFSHTTTGATQFVVTMNPGLEIAAAVEDEPPMELPLEPETPKVTEAQRAPKTTPVTM